MIRAFVLTAVLLLAPAASLAAPAWTVDPAASSLTFQAMMEGQKFTGTFRRWTAQIRLDPADLATSSVTATIDMTSAVTGNADRDAALPDDPWFAAAKFPRATFTATKFRKLGEGRYAADGTLTIRGVAKPLTLPFSLAITGEVAKMNAGVALNRLAFGVGQDEWKSVETVPATVGVTISLTARRAK